MKKHLELLTHASCIMQAAHACLDDVPLIFGTLTKEYCNLQIDDGNDEKVIEAMLKCIEKCWKDTNQEIAILTIILHPALKLAPFATLSSFSCASIWSMISHAWKQSLNLSTHVGPNGLFDELCEYLDGTGKYLTFDVWVKGIVMEAEKKASNKLLFLRKPTYAMIDRGRILIHN
ncbi:hypothetical protein APHAL10511_004168 [Amanita phalloides]|nr:hypothetical protein APHAL10511_004168 [Amanita phalloides]